MIMADQLVKVLRLKFAVNEVRRWDWQSGRFRHQRTGVRITTSTILIEHSHSYSINLVKDEKEAWNGHHFFQTQDTKLSRVTTLKLIKAYQILKKKLS